MHTMLSKCTSPRTWKNSTNMHHAKPQIDQFTQDNMHCRFIGICGIIYSPIEQCYRSAINLNEHNLFELIIIIQQN